jgi:hypothetical protein
MQPFATHRPFKDENAGSLNQAHGAIESSRRLPTLLGEFGGSGQSRIRWQAGNVGTGKNGRHALVGMPVFGRLAGYKGLNDAEGLRHDPAMRWRQGSARRCSCDDPDGPLRDPTALGCQELVCSHVPFAPMHRRVADTSWRWRI